MSLTSRPGSASILSATKGVMVKGECHGLEYGRVRWSISTHGQPVALVLALRKMWRHCARYHGSAVVSATEFN